VCLLGHTFALLWGKSNVQKMHNSRGITGHCWTEISRTKCFIEILYFVSVTYIKSPHNQAVVCVHSHSLYLNLVMNPDEIGNQV
jgi:hypothetical protein